MPAAPGLPVIWFTVPGLPGPQGSKRHVGGGRLIESSTKVKPWRAAVEGAAREAQGDGWTPLDGALHLVVEFYMPRPKGHPRTRRTVPSTTPDLSKLIRATEDALTTAGTYVDDARIVDHTLRERYATEQESIRLAHEMRTTGAKIALYRVDVLTTMTERPLIDFGDYLDQTRRLVADHDNPPVTTLERVGVTVRSGAMMPALAELADARFTVAVGSEAVSCALTDAEAADTLHRWATGDRNYLPPNRSTTELPPTPAVFDELRRLLRPGRRVLIPVAPGIASTLLDVAARLAGLRDARFHDRSGTLTFIARTPGPDGEPTTAVHPNIALDEIGDGEVLIPWTGDGQSVVDAVTRGRQVVALGASAAVVAAIDHALSRLPASATSLVPGA